MMDDQRQHELRWYKERQALKQTQLARINSSAKAQSILQSLGARYPVPSTPGTSNVDTAAELAEFDQKIYAAQQSMEAAMTAELKALGVPFFGTHEGLVMADGYDPSEWQLQENQAKHCGLVAEPELLVLRRRMIQHLEDLYRD